MTHYRDIPDDELTMMVSPQGGPGAHAELTRRNTEAVKALTAATARSASRLLWLTWGLALTVALVVLGVITLAVAD